MANIEELKSIFTNNNLGYSSSSRPKFLYLDGYLSSTLFSSTRIYGILGYNGAIYTDFIAYNTANYVNIFCVKR